jgi:uncharacterized protein YndB with AHSA1/START domain
MSTTASKQVPRAVADVTGGTIIATVEIAAPPERVFKAVASEEITKWWGSPATYQTTEWTGDVRVGGKWRSQGKSADGSTFAVEGEFLQVEPPHHLVHTWKAPWDGNHVTTVTCRLEAIDGGTRVTLRHEGFAGRPESCAGHAEGWERVLGWLKGFVSPAAGRKRFFFCRLIPPRPTFAHDMNEAESKAMKEHASYWRSQADAGIGIVAGPVGDPTGPYGIGVVRLGDDNELQPLLDADPVIRAGIGMRWESLRMMAAIVRD